MGEAQWYKSLHGLAFLSNVVFCLCPSLCSGHTQFPSLPPLQWPLAWSRSLVEFKNADSLAWPGNAASRSLHFQAALQGTLKQVFKDHG